MTDQPNTVPRQRRIQLIQLEPYDDVTSLRDRLQFVTAGRVLLVFPKDSKILQRKLDLVLIQREAGRRKIHLALVTQNPVVMDNALELNLSVFHTVEQARTRRWKRPDNKVFIDRHDRPPAEHDTYELMLAASRLKPPPSLGHRIATRVIRGIIFGIMILFLLFGLYAVVPSATVTLTPAGDQLNSQPIVITADPNISRPVARDRRVPIRVETLGNVEGRATIESSGIRPAEDALAEGMVTLTNNTGLAIEVPVGTILRTDPNLNGPGSDPVEFEIIEAVDLPARQGATRDARIRARDIESSSGPAGNVFSDTIIYVGDPELAGSISVNNSTATVGGGLREAAYVTPVDHERLLTLARQEVVSNARIRLDSDNLLLVGDPPLPEITNERTLVYSADINEPAELVTLTLYADVSAEVIDLNEAQLVALDNLGDIIPSGRVLDENSLQFRLGEVRPVEASGQVEFVMRVEGRTVAEIREDQLRDRIAGMSADEARSIIESEYLLSPNDSLEIETWPGFLNRMPLMPIRIQINVEQ
jgi:hypothetical protein